MKKIALLSGIMFLLNFSLSAQDESFRFGINLSPNFNWLSSNASDITTEGTNFGLRLGFQGEYFFAERYALAAGLGFAFNQGGTLMHTQAGDYWSQSELANVDFHALPENTSLKYSIQYLEIPIGLKMLTNEFGYFRYYAEPGINLGIRTQARGDIFNGDAQLNDNEEDVKADVNLLNLSWGIGAGAEYSINANTILFLGVHYANGFLDVTDDKALRADGENEDSNGLTRAVTIKIGVFF